MVTPSGALTGSLGNNTDAPQNTPPRLLWPVQDPWQAHPQGTQAVQHFPVTLKFIITVPLDLGLLSEVLCGCESWTIFLYV